jgi:hypothetical protein
MDCLADQIQTWHPRLAPEEVNLHAPPKPPSGHPHPGNAEG